MTVNKNELFLIIFLIIIFLLSFVPILNVILTVVILVLTMYFMRSFLYKEAMVLISILYITFNYIVLIIGNLFLEVYYAPIFKQSSEMFTGSTLRLGIYIFFFYKTFSNKFKKYIASHKEIDEKKSKSIKIRLIYILVLIILVVCQLISLNVIMKHGIVKGDRFGFERLHMNSIEISAKWLLIKISFFIGVLYTGYKRKGLIFLNVISIVILKMLGIKFGEIFLNITYLLVPISISYIDKKKVFISTKTVKKNIKKGLKVFIIFILLAILNLSIIYSNVYETNVFEGLNKIAHRIAGQSVLYHFIDNETNIIPINIKEFKNEVVVIGKLKLNLTQYLKDGNEPIGLFKLNKSYDLDSYKENITKGYTLSGGFPGIIIYYFGFLISFVWIYLMSILLAKIYNDLSNFLRADAFIGILIIYQLFDYIYSILILGNVYYLFRITFLVRIVALIIYKLYIKHMYTSKNIH